MPRIEHPVEGDGRWPAALLRRDEDAPSNDREIGCSVQEETIFGVLDDPLQAFLEVLARHGTTRHDPPFVRVNVV